MTCWWLSKVHPQTRDLHVYTSIVLKVQRNNPSNQVGTRWVPGSDLGLRLGSRSFSLPPVARGRGPSWEMIPARKKSVVISQGSVWDNDVFQDQHGPELITIYSIIFMIRSEIIHFGIFHNKHHPLIGMAMETPNDRARCWSAAASARGNALPRSCRRRVCCVWKWDTLVTPNDHLRDMMMNRSIYEGISDS